ncbi:MAG: hypothetical protein HYY18_09305 [Planctomycetes bacterium]|nr:hypothetical protein [Planctomycetota bacterium]
MRPAAVFIVLAHLAAVVATAGIPLCRGADGHESYELQAGGCCAAEAEAPHADGHTCANACGDCGGACVRSAPDCGDCVDEISPVSAGLKSVTAVVLPPADAGVADGRVPGALPACRPAAVLTQAAPAAPVPLRC